MTFGFCWDAREYASDTYSLGFGSHVLFYCSNSKLFGDVYRRFDAALGISNGSKAIKGITLKNSAGLDSTMDDRHVLRCSLRQPSYIQTMSLKKMGLTEVGPNV